MINQEEVLNALKNVIDPDLHNNLVDLNMIEDVKIEEKKVSFKLILTTPACPLKDKLRMDCETSLKEKFGQDLEVEIIMGAKVRAHNEKKSEKENLLPDVKNVILIASGKGGVGKSTVAVNIAIALAQSGAAVGLLDADIYGPSIPLMMGVLHEKPRATGDEEHVKILPFEKYGIRFMSIGFFVEPEKALIWRGPIASNALKQLFTDVEWGSLDYLIIDTPPGTGDIHLTLLQSLNVAGVAVVTTPQQVALSDARKAVNLFRQDSLKVPVLGIIENMSYFTPEELPDKKYYLFGKGGGSIMAKELSTPLLGEIPVVESLCASGDTGRPVATDKTGLVSEAFHKIAGSLSQQVSVWNAFFDATKDIEPHKHKH